MSRRMASGFGYALVAVFLPSLVYSGVVDDLLISNPIEGIEGQNVTIYCITNNSDYALSGLLLQVGNSMLPAGRLTSLDPTNSTHKGFILHNLDRRPFTTVNQPGDNGMPLKCTFSEFTSTASNVIVIYNDFVALASSRDNAIVISLGGSDRIPLNISANQAEVTITRANGSNAGNAINVSMEYLTINEAGQDDTGMYNITVGNLAGTTSLSVSIEVQFPAIFNFKGDDSCDNISALQWYCKGEPGSDIQLNCSFEASPLGTLNAIFNGMDLPANTPNNVALSGTTIVITNFDPSTNAGEYNCSVTNTINDMAMTSTLSILLNSAGARSLHQYLVWLSVCLLAFFLSSL